MFELFECFPYSLWLLLFVVCVAVWRVVTKLGVSTNLLYVGPG